MNFYSEMSKKVFESIVYRIIGITHTPTPCIQSSVHASISCTDRENKLKFEQKKLFRYEWCDKMQTHFKLKLEQIRGFMYIEMARIENSLSQTKLLIQQVGKKF